MSGDYDGDGRADPAVSHPFGEEIYTAQRTQGLAYSADSVRKQFTGYERDNEIEMDFAQARYFAYNHGRFTSPDPLAASANAFRPQSWNRYTYSYNNPLRYTDPSGMIAGDFYNQDGDYLGTDGINDGKLYVVTNKDQAKQIQKTDKNKGTTQVSAVSSAIELPSLLVRQAVGAAVDRSNSPTADDKKGGFHEEGFIAGPALAGGQETIQVAAPGAVSDPRVDTKATIDTTNPANPAQAGTLADITVKAHVHPGGVLTSSSGPPPGVIGGTVTTSRADFVQPPSAVDTQNASALPGVTHIVAGARSKTVYIYDGSGVRATFPLKQFITITPRRR
ncbi:MAG: RHS repeat-associated core domain-containing protein [Pyrinomonadaceae bacterium]